MDIRTALLVWNLGARSTTRQRSQHDSHGTLRDMHIPDTVPIAIRSPGKTVPEYAASVQCKQHARFLLLMHMYLPKVHVVSLSADQRLQHLGTAARCYFLSFSVSVTGKMKYD